MCVVVFFRKVNQNKEMLYFIYQISKNSKAWEHTLLARLWRKKALSYITGGDKKWREF